MEFESNLIYNCLKRNGFEQSDNEGWKIKFKKKNKKHLPSE